MAEYHERWQHPSTENVLKPNQRMLSMPVGGNIYAFTFPAYTRRIRVRMLEGVGSPGFDVSYEPTMPNYESIPSAQVFQEDAIYCRHNRTMYFRPTAPGTAQITFWNE